MALLIAPRAVFPFFARCTRLRPALWPLIPRMDFHAAPIHLEKAFPPRPKIDEDDIEESFLKGSGPGGQKINKTSSAVQLIHKPTGIVVKTQDTRSRSQNRKIARVRLAERIEHQEKGDESRVAIKAARASKKKASTAKKTRRKYRALEAEKQAGKDASGPEEKSKSSSSEPQGPAV